MSEPISLKNRTTLKEILEKEQIFAPCIWDCMSARVAEMAGFKAVLLSSACLSYSMIGMPDIALLTADELVAATERISSTCKLPVIVDADEGYGDSPLNVYRTCQRLAKAGAMAITIDDSTAIRGLERAYAGGSTYYSNDNAEKHKINLKICSTEALCAKIKAAVAAVEGTDCMIIARTAAKRIYGLDDAIDRMARCAKLGAHMTMVLNIGSLAECEKINEAIPGWKMFPDVYSVNGKPVVALEDIAKLGFNLVTCHFLEKGAMWGMMEYAQHTIADKSTAYADKHDMNGVFENGWMGVQLALSDFQKWLSLEDEFNTVE